MLRKWLKRVVVGVGSVLGLVALALGGLALAQIDFSDPEDLAQFMNNKLRKTKIPGMSALIIKDGTVHWAGQYGYADLAASRPVTAETIFQIASVSKTVTGVAVMQLYERGLLDLDASLNRYLPFAIVNPHHPNADITTRMLLQHTSSLLDHDAVLESTYTIASGLSDPEMTLEAFVRAYYLPDGQWYDVDKNFSTQAPGAAYSYSNAAFGLLGYLIEQVAGQPFNTYCRAQIFAPLGMTSTGWLTTDIDRECLTVQYDGDTPLQPYSFATYPDGALKTTPRDYARFLLAMLHDGSYDGQRILAPATVAEMLPPDGSRKLVWHANPFPFLGRELIGHSGGDPGVLTLVYFTPDHRTGVIVFMNSAPTRIDFKVVNLVAIFKRLNALAEI